MNANSSTTNQWLTKATKQLEAAGVGTARLDCLVLLEDLLGKDRSYILAHPEITLTQQQFAQLEQMLERRKNHEPLAYIRGKTEFYGREFIVDARVLEPRPESEAMITLLKKLPLHKDGPCAITDVGTGSGALGITAALENPGSTVDLIDIDPGCLVVARKNMELHKVTAELIQGDLLDKTKRSPDIVLANLPYVPDDYVINQAAMREPRLAIFGGADGLDLYRKLFGQVTKKTHHVRYVLTESLPIQHEELRKIAKQTGYDQIVEEDFVQVFADSPLLTG